MEFIAVLLRLMVYYFVLPSPVVCQGHFLLWVVINAVCLALVALILLCQTHQNKRQLMTIFIINSSAYFLNYSETILKQFLVF